jgi:hypothetical protein
MAMMSQNEQNELVALFEWVQTFPQFQRWKKEEKYNNTWGNEKENDIDINKGLDDPSVSSLIFDVALEIFQINEKGEETTITSSYSSDMWDNIITVTTQARMDKTSKKAIRKFDAHSPTSIHVNNHSNWKDCTNETWKHLALTNLLSGAVTHPNMHLREGYIRTIIELPKDTQTSLMALIEGRVETDTRKRSKAVGSTSSASTSRSSNSSRKKPTSRSGGSRGVLIAKDSNASPLVAPLFNPKFSPKSMFYEAKIRELEDKNQILRMELENSRRKENEMIETMQDNKSKLPQEETKELYDSKVSALEQDLRRMTVAFERDGGQREMEETEETKDVMRTLMHTKRLMDETTERLNVLKEKLQQLNTVQEALRREEQAHSKTVEENLRLQNESSVLRPLKRQLEDCKSIVTKANVELMDCHDELMDTKQNLQVFREEKLYLQGVVRSQNEELQVLTNRIQKEEEDAFEYGESISELNPRMREESIRIQQKLLKLRQERQSSPYAHTRNHSVDDIIRKEIRTLQRRFLSEETQLEELKEDSGNDGRDPLVEAETNSLPSMTTTSLRFKNRQSQSHTTDHDSLKQLIQLHRQEMAKLQSENARLKASSEKVATAQKEVNSNNRLGEQYRNQYLGTKIELQTTKMDLPEVMMKFYQPVE